MKAIDLLLEWNLETDRQLPDTPSMLLWSAESAWLFIPVVNDWEEEHFLCSSSLWILTKTKALEAVRTKVHSRDSILVKVLSCDL